MQAAALAAVLGVTLTLLRGDELWNDSDGQYLMTGRLLADGHDLYGEVAAAQPPLMYVLAAAALELHDSWVAPRLLFAGLQIVTAVLVALLALRLSAPRWAAVLGAGWALFTPWALHEHGSVLPELVATPLLLGAVLAAVERPRLAGALGALAIGAKLPVVVPALLLLWTMRQRRPALEGLVIGLAAQAVVWGIWFGPGDLLKGTITAQLQIGGKSGHDSAAYIAQSAWSLVPLLVLALIGWRLTVEDDTRRTLAATTAGAAITLISIGKLGTLPVIAIPLEALLLPFALVAVADLVAARGSLRSVRVRLAGTLAVGLALLAAGAQMLSPSAPRGFTWPGGGTNWARVYSSEEVDRQEAIARRCPRRMAWPGSVWIAVLTHRRAPGNQGDPFILQAETYARQAATRQADQICQPADVVR